MKNRKFGLYISLGIEVNNLILSGLATKLMESGEVVALVNYDSPTLNKLLNEYDIPKENIADLSLKKQVRNKSENYFLSSRRARLRLNGIIPIGWRGNSTKKHFKDYLIGNNTVYSILNKLASKKNKEHYYNVGLVDFIHKYALTDIVVQSYSSPDVMSLAITAKQTGCKVWVINWGWKNFFINEFVPFKPNGFFTWNTKSKSLYLQFNTNLKSNEIYDFSLPGYDSFFNYKPNHSKEFYSQKYGFSSNKPIIIYTLVNTEVYAYEEKIIEKLIDSLKTNSLNVVLLLKPNPMDKDLTRFDSVVQQNENVVITENMWLYDRENNFNMMTKKAKIEWMDLLYYCEMSMNIPSTVTIESLIMKKPVFMLVSIFLSLIAT